MKQKLIIGFSVLLLIAVVVLISRDLFTSEKQSDENPLEYNIDKYRNIDTSLIKYKETGGFELGNDEIYGLALTTDNNLYVAGKQKVAKYSLGGKKEIEFNIDSTAYCIAANGNNIYLGIGNHIEHFNLNGKLLQSWNPYNEKAFITSVACNGEFVYVADAENNRVLKYNQKGTLVLEIGKKDTSKGYQGFVIPSLYFELAFGAYNDLWVVNPGKHRIENYTLNGELQSMWGTPSLELEGFAGCCNPVVMAILPNGNFVTYEKGMDRIKEYSPTGKFECVIAGPTIFKNQSDLYCQKAALVNDIVADNAGNIYILDAGNKLRIFSKK